MRKNNLYCHIEKIAPTQDKRLRAVPIQQRMRVGSVRWDIEADWYEDHKDELRSFPKGKKKDRVDAIAWLGIGIEKFVEAPTQEEQDDEEWELEYEAMIEDGYDNIDICTGY